MDTEVRQALLHLWTAPRGAPTADGFKVLFQVALNTADDLWLARVARRHLRRSAGYADAIPPLEVFLETMAAAETELAKCREEADIDL